MLVHVFPPLIHRKKVVLATLAAVALSCGVLATAPALAADTTHTAATTRTVAGMANLPVKKATETCEDLADSTTSVSGLPVQVAEYQVGSYAAGDPQYCALTGDIATYIGFEILLPTTTWRQRYLQTGCGGLCGSIGISAPESSGYKALEDGYFVVASDDEGHSGSGDSWYSNKTQLVDFAYQSDHDLAVVAKGLAAKFYGARPRYSYFDGCSQGGHEALTEVQRYPRDFNGVLAGAPASIMTELNSILHEYETAVNIDSASHPIVTEADAELVGDAALKACDPKTGLMLDYRSCEQKFNINTLLCTKSLTTNCLSSEQIKVMEEIYDGPLTSTGQQLYPGGYPLGSEWGLGLPTSTTTTVTKDTMFAAWLEYFAFEKDIGVTGIDDEQFTAAYFKQIEKLAPFWDATDPDLSSFEHSGGKLVLWQGESDWSIPTISSIAYYQAVVKAMGGVASTQRFARYYLLPGVGHCGSGAPDTYAGLASVVSWTETGKAPTALTATEYSSEGTGGGPPPGGSGSDLTDTIPDLGAAPTGSVVRSDTLFPYPELPAYKGYGNVDDASSYVGKVSKALEEPVHWLGKFTTTQEWCNSSGTDCRLVNNQGRRAAM
jgi:feruloyl esterase